MDTNIVLNILEAFDRRGVSHEFMRASATIKTGDSLVIVRTQKREVAVQNLHYDKVTLLAVQAPDGLWNIQRGAYRCAAQDKHLGDIVADVVQVARP